MLARNGGIYYDETDYPPPVMATPLKKLAVSKDFRKSYQKLNNIEIRNKVDKTLVALLKHRAGKGLNYESLEFADPSFRSIRLNKAYRIILSEQPNTYILLWIDNHDEAYQWACGRKLQVNPFYGHPEIKDIIRRVVSRQKLKTHSGSVFDNFSDTRLKALLPHVSKDFIKQLRSYETIWEYIGDEEYLVQELGAYAYEMLGNLICDADEQKTKKAELSKAAIPKTVDDALMNDLFNTDFRIVSTEKELQEVMECSLSQWRVFLHPEQRSLIDRDFEGPVCVTGGAGTGKTVVALHRAAYLSKQLVKENKPGKILFTNFTKSLTYDANLNLQALCTPMQKARIEAINLDRWVNDFLKENSDEDFDPVYDSKEHVWNNVLMVSHITSDLPANIPEREVKKEWDQVIQEYDIRTEEEYLNHARKEHDLPLTKAQKKALWRVFSTYREYLSEQGYTESVAPYRMARELIAKRPELIRDYVSIIVDEAQDLSPAAYRLIAEMVKHCPSTTNNLFITGDGHQRIYSHYGILSQCGIGIKYHRRLTINYRTTEETRNWATRLLSGYNIVDLNGYPDSLDGYTSIIHGQEPLIYERDSLDEEIAGIVSYLENLKAKNVPFKNVCLAFNTNKQLRRYQKRLENMGYAFHPLSEAPTTIKKEELNIGTMHRSKGLEFDYMILPGMSEENVNRHSESPEETLRARALIHVAATRARKHLLVTSPGPPVHWLKQD